MAKTISFPSRETPQGKAARLLGLYDHRLDGHFMQRVRIPGGRLAPSAAKAIAELAERFVPNSALHLTTRQDIEFHGVRSEDVPALQQGLHEAGLTTIGSGGDTVRNITLCPGCCHAQVDLFPLVGWLQRNLDVFPGIYDLPRKFKISLSACPNACARPYLQDIGFIADGISGFTAILGGSLGPKPQTGIPFGQPISLEDILPFTYAALRLFAAEGDRVNRGHARLRHVHERLGDEIFRERFHALYAEEKKTMQESPPPLAPNFDNSKRVRMGFFGGEMLPETLRKISDACAAQKTDIRFGFEHDIHIATPAYNVLPADLHAHSALPRVVACPGNQHCRRGIVDTLSVARALQPLLAGCDLLIGIGGCPNHCSHAAVAEIGLSGLARAINGERQACFRLFLGGENGRGPLLASEFHAGIQPPYIAEAIAEIIRRWRADGRKFSDFCAAERHTLREHLARY